MAANEQLAAFLAEATPTDAAPAAPEAPQTAPTPEPTPTPAVEAKAPQAKPEDDDADPPAPIEGEAVVPRRALEAERRTRKDWKEKASRYEGENAELRRQLEAAKAPPQPAPQQQPVPTLPQLPDPNVDPIGYIQQVTTRQQHAMLNERLNFSEMMVRDKIGTEKLDGYVTDFKRAMETDPTLGGKLAAQAHPYAWLVKEVDRLRVLRDVGDDPASFRERLIAEERAKWEQEAAQRGPAVPQAAPLPNMAPSLATARSVASRSTPAWTGEATEQDVVDQIRARKQRSRQNA